jgi:hypothetical protein
VKTILLLSVVALAQLAPGVPARFAALADAVRPLLPYPPASPGGEAPADNSADSKWFVVWPSQPDDTRIVVRANPLHPETQKAAAAAMEQIHAAVVAAERRAQAAYEKAMDEFRRTGKGADLDPVTLDDVGIAGERIDAELEMVIELTPVESFDIASGVPPTVAEGTRGPAWKVTIPANTYRSSTADDRREHFRAAEVHLYFGEVARPDVHRQGDEPQFRVLIPPAPAGFRVVLRGNETLVTQLADAADWSRLGEHRLALLRPTKRERVEGARKCFGFTSGTSRAPQNSPSAPCW